MNSSAEKLPALAQMANRCHQGHIGVLSNLAAGKPAFDSYPIPEAALASTMRGRGIVMDTLRRWECVSGGRITERGRNLLAAKNKS